MAKQGEKIRKRGLHGISMAAPGDPLTKGVEVAAKKLDDKLQEKGAFFESSLAKSQREAEAAEKEQKEEIALQSQQESLRLAEAEDESARRKLLRRKGGRRSLIASR